MLNIFKRKRNDQETVFEEYRRLVEEGSKGSFLDVDTTLVIADRDEINDLIQKGNEHVIDLNELSRLDALFKKKIEEDFNEIKKQIKLNTPDREYLEHVIQVVSSYGVNEPTTKWWFHLLDDKQANGVIGE